MVERLVRKLMEKKTINLPSINGHRQKRVKSHASKH